MRVPLSLDRSYKERKPLEAVLAPRVQSRRLYQSEMEMTGREIRSCIELGTRQHTLATSNSAQGP